MEQVIRVVIVDDSRLMRQFMRKLLEMNGEVEVVGEAEDGGAAVDISRSLHPDVVLMDVEMPVMDGIEATRKIKQEGLAGTVVIVSAYGSPDRRRAAKDAGADQFVEKDSAVKDIDRLLSVMSLARKPVLPELPERPPEAPETF